MKKINTFFYDFVGVFVVMVFGVCLTIIQIAHNIGSTTIKSMNNIIRPAFVELLADINLILNVAWQGFLEVSSNILLKISKITLIWSRLLHERAERLLFKNWDI